MSKFKKVKNETESEEFLRLFPVGDYRIEFNNTGEVILIEDHDDNPAILSWSTNKKLVEEKI